MENEKFYLDGRSYRLHVAKNIFVKIILYAFLITLSIFIIIPFYWMINTSLKSIEELSSIPPTIYPHAWRFKNYVDVFTKSNNFGRYFGNTLIVGFFTTLGMLFTTILASFAFSRLRFKGREFLFSAILLTMMVPGEMYIITNYITVTIWGWKNTFEAMIIPFTASVFNIFFLRQTFLGIPDELYYAAKVDGTSDFKYLWKVMIPIAKPTITTITILGMFGAWNAYIWPNLVVNEDKLRLVSNGLMSQFRDEVSTNFNLQLAATTLVTMPLLFAFLLLKKYIVRGVSRAGIKG